MEKAIEALVLELENKLKKIKTRYLDKLTAHVELDVAHTLCSVGRDLHNVLEMVSNCPDGKE